MQSEIAFDVSMGKSYMVIYNAARSCIFEGEILHNHPHFEQLYKQIMDIVQKDGQIPAIVFEATGVYSRPLERFMNDHGFSYCLLNPLNPRFKRLLCTLIKPIKVMHTVWPKLTSQPNGA